MEGDINSKTPEKETKNADYMRKELEQFPFIKNPIEQWSDMEKEKFLKWCNFNNFTSQTAPIALMEDEQRANFKDNPLFNDVRQAFINSGANIEELRSRLNRNEELWEIFTNDPEKFVRDESFEKERKERVDNLVHFFVAVLPAILDLIDKGYTKIELSR